VAVYLDTSALVKLVVAESESEALRAWLVAEDRVPVSSDLARAELLRAVRRVSPARAAAARAVLETVTLVRPTTATFEHAGLLDPVVVRSLDALHLAAALELGDDLDELVTYDDRMADAASRNGIRVVAPR
jgi:uncharacterized protein